MVPDPQRVLVTGGTGFLGSHIVQQLLQGGYTVRCTARPLKSRFLETAYLDRVRAGQLEVVEVDDLTTANLERVLAGITAVIHTACPAPGSMDDTQLLLDAISSTTSLLRQAYEQGIRKFVLTSSYLAMVGAGPPEGAGDSDNQGDQGGQGTGVWSDYVFSDTDWTHATYESVFTGNNDPAWAYAAAKTLVEASAWDFASARHDFDLATILPTLLLGPFAPGHPILSTSDLSTNVLLHSLLTSDTPPHPVWPHFVDVRDAARAHVKALEAPSLGDHSSVASTSTDASSDSDLKHGSGPSKTHDKPRKSENIHLKSLSSSSNPSLVDLGTTLQHLEMTFQTTLELHSSQHPTPFPSSSSTTSSAKNSATLPFSAAADPSSPSSSSSRHPTPFVSPIMRAHPRATPRKRFIATGASFMWPDAIAHLRTVRSDLAESLPDERACMPMPETVAGVEGAWSGSAWACSVRLGVQGGVRSCELEEGVQEVEEGEEEIDPLLWRGLDIEWRDWRETLEDAVRDVERVAGSLEQSGWEDLFGGDDEDDGCDDDGATRETEEDGQEKGS